MADDDRMETEEEEEEEDDDDEGQGVSMMNFMFGNVDSHGELEGDFLDEVCLTVTCRDALSTTEHDRTTSHCCSGSQAELRWSSERTGWPGHVGKL